MTLSVCTFKQVIHFLGIRHSYPLGQNPEKQGYFLTRGQGVKISKLGLHSVLKTKARPVKKWPCWSYLWAAGTLLPYNYSEANLVDQ
jgi:hypothetical protein